MAGLAARYDRLIARFGSASPAPDCRPVLEAGLKSGTTRTDSHEQTTAMDTRLPVLLIAGVVILAGRPQSAAVRSLRASGAASEPAAAGVAASAPQAAPAAGTAAPVPPSNPFLSPSPLPFQAPPFDRIKDSDFQPAIEEGMRRQIAEVEVIAGRADPPTFANTIEAMERSGDLLTRVTKVFFNLTQMNTNDTLQKVEAEVAPRLTAHQDAIFMNRRLFERVKALYDRRASLHLEPDAAYLVERDYRNFVRAGALLDEADQARLRAINEEEARLTTEFRRKLLADTDRSAVVVSDTAELAGLTDQDVTAAAQAARDRGLEGRWVLALRNTTQQPILDRLQDRRVRSRVLAASLARCDNGGPNDTTGIVARMAQLRAQKAALLGFPSYAAYALDDQMAKTPQAAEKLMTDLVPAATEKARADAAKMQQIIDRDRGGFRLGPEDWEFYAEKLRKAEYDLDESQIKPYFELDRVVRDGVFFAAHKLYGLTFKERKDIPVYQPDVRVFDVFDASGRPIALFYGDYYARPNKNGGAWMDSFVDQSRLLGLKPVVLNLTNFTRPAPGQPALLSWDDVTTLFHEFGHALHGMLSDERYPTLSGTAVPRDFVEFPSQINEHWALEPEVFAHFAKHYQTGAPMPAALLEKITKARTFDQGYMLTEYLSAALLDMAWHTLPADAPLQDVNRFEREALARFKVDLPQVPPRYRTTYFSHLWSLGYAAGYYAYLWAEVLDDDAYYWFRDHGGMTPENGQRLRDTVLARGGSKPADAMYRDFRGRDPQVQPLLIERGLATPPGTPGY
jgi:peptidyl-dipeptidase Dcp